MHSCHLHHRFVFILLLLGIVLYFSSLLFRSDVLRVVEQHHQHQKRLIYHSKNHIISSSQDQTTKLTNVVITNIIEDDQQQQQHGKQYEYTNNIRSLQSKIVGGIPVTGVNEFPSFGYSTGYGLCGGTLIYYDMFLTAAHCRPAFKNIFIPGIQLNSTILISQRNGFNVNIDKIIPHPQFNRIRLKNDIMIVKLLEPVYNISLQKLNFNKLIPKEVNDKVTYIGMGTTSFGGPISSQLLKVSVLTLNNTNCKKYWGANLDPTIHLCAGILKGGKDACQGDSGGPVYYDGDGSQVGIVSYGDECAKPNTYPVNTRISAYEDFITTTVCGFSDAIVNNEISSPFDCTTLPRLRRTCSCTYFNIICRILWGCLFTNY